MICPVTGFTALMRARTHTHTHTRKRTLIVMKQNYSGHTYTV